VPHSGQNFVLLLGIDVVGVVGSCFTMIGIPSEEVEWVPSFILYLF